MLNFNAAVQRATAEQEDGYVLAVGQLIALVNERLEALPLSERAAAAAAMVLSLREGSQPAHQQLQSGATEAPDHEEARKFLAALAGYPVEQRRVILLMLNGILADGVVITGNPGSQRATPNEIVMAREAMTRMSDSGLPGSLANRLASANNDNGRLASELAEKAKELAEKERELTAINQQLDAVNDLKQALPKMQALVRKARGTQGIWGARTRQIGDELDALLKVV